MEKNHHFITGTILNFFLGISLALLLTMGIFQMSSANPGVIYVDQDAGGANNGSSWANAYVDLQDALLAAVSGDEIWVAEGVYKPGGPGERTATFTMTSGVALYGGFAGIETLREERDWAANVTVLSGDIDDNDLTDPNGVVTTSVNIAGSNAYHVVTANSVAGSTLDGFTITAGQANEPVSSPDQGGGMYIESSSPTLVHLSFAGNTANNGGGIVNISSISTLTDVAFSGNQAGGYGGGLHNEYGSPVLSQVSFTRNLADEGGGMSSYHNSGPTLNNVTFTENQANSCGGMVNYDHSNSTLENVIFQRNSATIDGGGLCNGGGSSPSLTDIIFSDNRAAYGGGNSNISSSAPTLSNITFINNVATERGGGMYNTDSSPILNDVSFSGNRAATYGGGIYNSSSNPTLTNVTLSGNVAYSGGGMRNLASSPTLTSVRFSNNRATMLGGGVYNTSSDPAFTNVVLYGNNASFGGGMYNTTSDPTSTNITYSGNRASGLGGGIFNESSSPVLVNCILWGDIAIGGPEIFNNGGTPTLTYCDVQGGYTGIGNINMDPLFLGQAAGDLHLRAGSPVIDAGDMAACPTEDYDGRPRPYGLGCDMGAFEFQNYVAELEMSASDLTPEVGQVVMFTIVLTNTGRELTEGSISDTLPDGLNFLGPITLEPAGVGVVGSAPPVLAHSLVITTNQQVTVTFPASIALDLAPHSVITNTVVFASPLLASPASASLVLTLPNHGPQAFPDAFTVPEDSLNSLDVLANDSDVDGDILTISALGLPDQGGTLVNAGSTITYTPALNFAGTEVFTYTMSDGYGGQDTAQVTMNITNVNDPPIFTSTPVLTATQDTPYTYSVTTTDLDLVYGDTLIIAATSLPAWLTLTDHGDGTAALVGTPASAQVGEHMVVLQVTDSIGGTATQTFVVTVERVQWYLFLPVILRTGP